MIEIEEVTLLATGMMNPMLLHFHPFTSNGIFGPGTLEYPNVSPDMNFSNRPYLKNSGKAIVTWLTYAIPTGVIDFFNSVIALLIFLRPSLRSE